MLFQKAAELPTAETALPGRDTPLATDATHFVLGHALKGPHPEGFETAVLAWAASGAWSGCSGSCRASG